MVKKRKKSGKKSPKTKMIYQDSLQENIEAQQRQQVKNYLNSG